MVICTRVAIFFLGGGEAGEFGVESKCMSPRGKIDNLKYCLQVNVTNKR